MESIWLQRFSFVSVGFLALCLMFYISAMAKIEPSKPNILVLVLFFICQLFCAVTDSGSWFLIIQVMSMLLVLALVGFMLHIGYKARKHNNGALMLVMMGIILLSVSVLLYLLLDDLMVGFMRVDELGFVLFLIALCIAYPLRLMVIQQQLRELGLRISDTTENERTRLARELHDGVNQRLAATRMYAQMFESTHSTKPEISDALLKVMGEMSTIVKGLHSHTLTSIGLTKAIQDDINAQNMLDNTDITLEVDGDVDSINESIALHLYRLFQECISNAKRHGLAEHILVNLQLRKNRVTMIISDDGSGFDVVEGAQRSGAHYGLLNMQERVDLLEGRLSFSERQPTGTVITIEVKNHA
ncbi:MAG: hypothetical protein HOM11_06780 [Methylococcales bacterium]|nr:hypothetical protein [Methylococcales bacterium]MBT7444520.1 hypothetical protein [Methylococcales bacterium]